MLIEKLEELFISNTPFAFSRFNDGEIGGLVQPNFIASRGAQIIDTNTGKLLLDALTYRQDNYWVGIPCEVCYPTYYSYANELVGDYKFKTLAVDLINRNYIATKSIFKRYLKDKNVHWVGGEDQNLSEVQKEYNFKLISQHNLPTTNSMEAYDVVKNLHKEHLPGSVIITSLGPLERILTKEWFQNNPKSTYLGLGSFFDPLTRNVEHGYHKGTTNSCTQCN